jgi:LuxR family transcriptional regulator, maltose regulon positive regulatory protein
MMVAGFQPRSVAQAKVSSDRDVLLATKLHVPWPTPGLVPRPRLTDTLDEGLGRGLLLVCAPAGYGKTVLLADWVRRAHPAVAWLSLDGADNDPARFWRHGLAALDQVRPGLAERVEPVLGPPAPTSYTALVTVLINDMTAGPGADDAVLVLDDYHLIESAAVHQSVAFLIEHRPPDLHLVLASRSDPPLPLARLRGRAQLTELRAADLRFTTSEAAALLRHTGADLPDAAVTALAARTEGWAAGLQLAGLSLRGKSDTAGFVAAFAGSHRYVLDFLAEEVLEQQNEEVRGFLMETSVLERLSGPLCDAVTGGSGCQALLEQVEQAGLFLVPLDEVRGWWRYHHLFADLLRARLQAEQPARAVELHHNAAAWYEDHGLVDDAIGHAVAAGDGTRAARLIEQHFDMVYSVRGEAATIHRWLSSLPADVISSRPRLLLAQAQLAAASGRLDAVEPLLDAAERAAATATDEPFEPTVGRTASLLVNLPALKALCQAYLAQFRGDADATARLAARVLTACGGEESLAGSIAQGFLGVAEWLRGNLTAADRAFTSSITGFEAAGQHTTTAWSGYSLVQIRRAQGRMDAAASTCRHMLAVTREPGRPPAPAAGAGYVGLAEIAYQRNDLQTALRQVTEGIALCRQFPYTPPLAAGLVTLAWIRQATGDTDDALAAMGEAAQVSPGPPGLLNPVPAQRARLLLARGDVAAAAGWTEESGLTGDDDLGYPREPGYLVLARLLLAQNRPGQALALLDRLRAAAAAQNRVGSRIEAEALRALALASGGAQAEALSALSETLILACPQGYVRVFADEGEPMAALLARVIKAHRTGQVAGVPLGFLASLQRAFDAEPAPVGARTPAGAMPGLVEPLTNRELEVLAMLATGKSNHAIADQLVVSLDTVKKHVSHLLDKLAAANRTEAVARAREPRLVP